jgi:hypothetical protein
MRSSSISITSAIPRTAPSMQAASAMATSSPGQGPEPSPPSAG